MMTNAVVCLADRKRAREIAMSPGRGYLNTMVNMYHDTMPPQKNAVYWPNPPHRIPDEATLDTLIEAGYLLCGTPDEVNEQIEKYQAVGCDQLVFGIPNEGFEHDEVLEMLELFGTKVIPNYDTDPEHSTTRYRREAKRKYPDYTTLPDDLRAPEVIPTNALKPLPY
jgi:alkanesulfonate monooxygenase SsuD/methylene tetrahydromethanopterin reductase-like flavin-dependent oxidoreductase (luciferase family)